MTLVYSGQPGKVIKHAKADSGVGRICKKATLGSRWSIANIEGQVPL